MDVTLMSVGDELLVGQVVNTNAAWLGDFLAGIGMVPSRTVVVGDSVEQLTEELRDAFERGDVVIVTGGLGPTHDDVTREAVAGFFGVDLHLDESWLRLVQRRFARRGMTVPERNRIQSMIPGGMQMLPNAEGTAPGFWKSWETPSGTKALAVMPGVPDEMKRMMRDQVGPLLEPLRRKPIRQITLCTTGIGESHLQELLAPEVEGMPATISLAYLPSPAGVRLRITERLDGGSSGEGATDFADRLSSRAAEYVFGRGEDRLETVVGVLLRRQQATVAAAESCTGGAVASLLTDVAGASDYVLGGVVAYSNSVKSEVLRIDRSMLAEHGAVSEPVALEMARSVRALTGSDYGLSTTGILGPTGGTPEKPVGTVWVACADENDAEARLLRLGRERLKNKQRTVAAALDLLRRRLVAKATP
jgi:nicotinamide-nucleotide amidase